MPTGRLHIDLEAVAANWSALDAMSAPTCETGAVVKADGYGLGADAVATRLARAGARAFFVATAEEGQALRRTLGPEPRVFVLYGHMAGDTDVLRGADLVPLVASVDQLTRHLEAIPRRPFGVQLDTGMSRLGLTAAEWSAVRDVVVEARPVLVTSHLACADDADHPQNAAQRDAFAAMTEGLAAPLSLAATGGTLLGRDYHHDLVRPGIGLYGGAPFAGAEPVVTLDLPVVQCFDLPAGASVGYGATWTAPADTRIATVAGGYADGLFRALQPGLEMMAGPVACPVVGRVSMDLLTVDIGHLDSDPESLRVLGPHRGVDALAARAGTIGYEVLTSLGHRYRRALRL